MNLINFVAFGNDITFVEDELRGEHVFTEPHSTESVQQTLVKVISHTASILDLTKHVAHTDPVYPLKIRKKVNNERNYLDGNNNPSCSAKQYFTNLLMLKILM